MNPSRFWLSRFVFAGVAWIALGLTAARAQSSLPDAQLGQNYSFQVVTSPAAADGTVYAATGLPSGLSIGAASGLIGGTPAAVGTFSGDINLTAAGMTNSFPYVLVVRPAALAPTVTSAPTATATVGTAFSYTVTATNNPASFNVTGLPDGLSANPSTGAIAGTPTSAGTYTVALSANNAAGTGAASTLTLTVNPAASAPSITSAITASAVTTAPFSYTITADNAPLSFAATPMPPGLSLNPATGELSGTPAVNGVYQIALSAANNAGTGRARTLTLTVGNVPAISSGSAASGTAGTVFTYDITATNAPLSFNVRGNLPTGLTVDTTRGRISGTPSGPGTSSLTLSANNGVGTGPDFTLTITVASAGSGGNSGGGSIGGGGGIGGGGIGGGGSSGGPTIATQPASVAASAGDSVTFSVVATGAGLSFQWYRDGVAIAGASSASFTIASAAGTDAGTYTVKVSNTAGAVTSSGATLTLLGAPVVPTIVTQPAAQRVAVGETATFSVAASGGGLAYQWRKDGVNIPGANSATFAVVNAGASSAGGYSVVVSNSAGTVTSDTAALTVFTRASGAYFGTLGSNAGSFALYVRPDNTGVFLAFIRSAKLALVSPAVNVDASGHFRFTIAASGVASAAATDGKTPQAAASDYTVDGTVTSDGGVTGAVGGLDLTLSAPAASTSGATTGVAGFYQAGVAGSSATSYAILGTSGEAYMLSVAGATADAGKGAVDASGNVDISTASGAHVLGTVQGARISLVAMSASAGSTTYVGANNEARPSIETLFNVSTRAQTNIGGNLLIAGFVISGDQPKPVLIRAVGPTLADYGVAGALKAAHLDIYKGSTVVAAGDDWAAAPNAAAVSAASLQVGAFALRPNSHDAAMLVTLDPGLYTAIVNGQGGASGVALVEAYDATVGAIPRAQRIINLSTRAVAGASDNTLIAGFVITGSVPKRVLVRGAGPSLKQYGVTGVLDPVQLAVFSGQQQIAQNTGWSTSPDAATIAAAALQCGAFPFAANSGDSALILNLAPGAYTAQINGTGGATGVALVEVYEIP